MHGTNVYFELTDLQKSEKRGNKKDTELNKTVWQIEDKKTVRIFSWGQPALASCT